MNDRYNMLMENVKSQFLKFVPGIMTEYEKTGWTQM